MRPIIERHQDYVMTVGTIAAGATARGILLGTDSDAPFCLRSIGGWRADRNDLRHAKLRFTDERGAWLQSEAVGLGLFGSLAGLTGLNALVEPHYPQQVYPIGSSITADITNTSASEWTGVKILFRGVKLYEAGSIYSPSYPACYRSLPFVWPAPLSFASATQTLLNNTLAMQAHFDFAIRGLTALTLASSAAATWSNLGVKLRDHWGKAYSNDYVQLDWLFSSALASRPGLLYPEIYVSASDNFYFDAQRSDAAGSALDLQLAFHGARIAEVNR